jgi:hypothetical protein
MTLKTISHAPKRLSSISNKVNPPPSYCRVAIVLLIILQPLIGLIFHDLYPFSSFPMFSNLKEESIAYKITTDTGSVIPAHKVDLAFFNVLNNQPRLSGTMPDGFIPEERRFSYNEIKSKLISKQSSLLYQDFNKIFVEEIIIGRISRSQVGVSSKKIYVFDQSILEQNE